MRPNKEFVFCIISCLALIYFVSYFAGGEYLLMRGLLSVEHQILSNRCNDCHSPFKNQFRSCANCHTETRKISLHSRGTVKCIFCHISHMGKELKINTESCLSKSCHEKMIKKGDHSGDPKMCLKCHPEHQPEKSRPEIKTSDLKFSHRLHTDERSIKAYYPCVSCHRIVRGKFKMGLPKATDQCNKCHSDRIGKHDIKEKISKRDCAWCHFPQKKNLKKLGKGYRLKFARFNHQDHFNLECRKCHYRIGTYNELDDISIFSRKEKYPFCTRCHPNKRVDRVSNSKMR